MIWIQELHTRKKTNPSYESMVTFEYTDQCQMDREKSSKHVADLLMMGIPDPRKCTGHTDSNRKVGSDASYQYRTWVVFVVDEQ